MIPSNFIPARIENGRWEGLPVSGPITSGYAANETFRRDLGWGEHNAIDIAAPNAEVIRCPYPGVVHYSFGDGVDGFEEGSLGTFIVIKHTAPDGSEFFTGYAHLLMQAFVSAGDSVLQGQPIGLVGYSGAVTPQGPAGAHLHFALMTGVGYFSRADDTFYDPALYVGAPLVPAEPATPAEITTSLTYVPMTREAVITSLNTGALFVDLNPSTPAVVVFTGNVGN